MPRPPQPLAQSPTLPGYRQHRLVAGLLMSVFDKDIAFHNAALYHGLRGLLIGLSIGFNFGALRLAKLPAIQRLNQHVTKIFPALPLWGSDSSPAVPKSGTAIAPPAR